MISSRKGSSSGSDSPNRLLPSGTTITGVNWSRPSSVSKCVYAGQINCGTSADGISDPAGSVSARLRVHALAGVHDGCTLIYVVASVPSHTPFVKPLRETPAVTMAK
jgi:hypothetical protein